MAAVVVAPDHDRGGVLTRDLRVVASDPVDLLSWCPRWPAVRQGASPVEFDRQRIGACLPAGLEQRLAQPVGALSIQELRPGSLWLLLLWGLTVPTADALSWLDPCIRASLLDELGGMAPEPATAPLRCPAPLAGEALTPLPESPFAMAWLSPAGAILRGNSSLELLLGRDAAALERCSWQELTHPDDLAGELARATQVLSGLRTGYRLSKRFLCPAGQARWADVAVSAWQAPDGTVSRLFLQAIDITEARTERQRMLQELEQLRRCADPVRDPLCAGVPPVRWDWASRAEQTGLDVSGAAHSDVGVRPDRSDAVPVRAAGSSHANASGLRDPLTGLLPRGVLFERLDALIRRRRRRRDRMGLLLCDIDQLSALNVRLGRDRGDRVLRATARRLQGSIREGDFVVRFGGDELLVVLGAVHQLERAIEVAERIRQATHAPIRLGEVEPPVLPSLSIGLTLLRDDEELDAALLRADMATHAAKAGGGNQVIVMPAMPPHPPVCIGTGVVRRRQRRSFGPSGGAG